MMVVVVVELGSLVLFWFKDLLLPTLRVFRGRSGMGEEWKVDLEGKKENIQHSSQSPQCEKVTQMRNQEVSLVSSLSLR